MIMALALFANNFEVSPLPAWTLIAFVYLCHFVMTYVATRWIYHGQLVSRSKTLIIGTTMVLGEFVIESLAFLFSSHFNFAALWASYTWKAIFLVIVYVVATWLAVKRVQKKQMATVAIPAAPTGQIY